MKLTIRRKLLALVALQVVAIFAILGVSYSQMRDTLLEERRLALRNIVETADSVVQSYAQLEQQGRLAREEAQTQALEAIRALRYAGAEYVWVNDLDAMMLAHPNPKLQGTDMSGFEDAAGKRFLNELASGVKRSGESYVEYLWRRKEGADPALKISFGRRSAWDWVVATGLYADDVAATANNRTMRLGVLLLIVAVVMISLTLIVTRSITRPLAATVASLNELAEGDGDLSRELPEDSGDELGDLGRAFNLFAGKLRSLVAEARGVAGRVSEAAGQLSNSAEEVAEATQSQASSLEETAASLEQITAAVKQNADSAAQAKRTALESHSAAIKGGEVVAEAVTAMAQINVSSRKIADIITTIDEIAFQTNLLALNAAVEAARAGEQGRGFAVVASEVQSLARRSAGAAKEIKVLIEDSVAKVDAGTQLVNRSGKTLEEIVLSVKRVSDIVAEIAAASGEQSAGVDQVNQAVTEMDHGVQSTAAQTGELSNTAQILTSEAMQLEALVGRFRIDANERKTVHGAGELDFAQAMKAHTEWKMRLRGYIDHPDGSLSPAEVARRDGCALGHWLHTHGQQCADCPEFAELVQEHARFHEEAGAIVRLADERAHSEAIARLSPEASFSQISAQVVHLLGKLKVKLSTRRAGRTNGAAGARTVPPTRLARPLPQTAPAPLAKASGDQVMWREF